MVVASKYCGSNGSAVHPKIKLPPTNFTSTLNGITWKAEMNPNYTGDEPSAVAITTDTTAVTITGIVAAGSAGGLKYKYT